MLKENRCETCKYFAQHYRKWGKTYRIVGWGHCPHPRMKCRTPLDFCPRWTEKNEVSSI